MEETAQFDEVLRLCERLDIEIRREHLGGDGGGICTMRGRRLLFVDLDADPATRLAAAVSALAVLPEIEDLYVPQVLRELFEAHEP